MTVGLMNRPYSEYNRKYDKDLYKLGPSLMGSLSEWCEGDADGAPSSRSQVPQPSPGACPPGQTPLLTIGDCAHSVRQAISARTHQHTCTLQVESPRSTND